MEFIKDLIDLLNKNHFVQYTLPHRKMFIYYGFMIFEL